MANIVYNYNNSNSDINLIQDVPKKLFLEVQPILWKTFENLVF